MGKGRPEGGLADVRFIYDAPAAVEAEACAATRDTAREIPLAILLMVDKSGSMAGTKWADATSAISGFVDDPASQALKVGLTKWSGSNCSADYSNLDVPMGLVSQNATAIKASMAITPNGSTPTALALVGIQKFCAAYMAANPTEKCIGVLITDGDPMSCGPYDAATLGNIAAAALQSGVLTYTMGMAGLSGTGISVLNTVAQQGGTDCNPNTADYYCDASTGGATAFLNALNLIRQQAINCEYAIPMPNGSLPDLNTIKVLFTTGAGGPGQPITKIAGASQCGAGAYWYFDPPASPAKIVLCPDTCNAVKSDPSAGVDIEVDCKSS